MTISKLHSCQQDCDRFDSRPPHQVVPNPSFCSTDLHPVIGTTPIRGATTNKSTPQRSPKSRYHVQARSLVPTVHKPELALSSSSSQAFSTGACLMCLSERGGHVRAEDMRKKSPDLTVGAEARGGTKVDLLDGGSVHRREVPHRQLLWLLRNGGCLCHMLTVRYSDAKHDQKVRVK